MDFSFQFSYLRPAPAQEFISLRQAHDQLLIESADVERRVSLLDDRGPGGSGPQIVSRMRAASMVHRRSSASSDLAERAFGSAPPDYYTGGAGGAAAAGAAAGAADGGQQATSSVATVCSSMSASVSTGRQLVRRLSRAVPAPACDSRPGAASQPLSFSSRGSEGPIYRHVVSTRLSDPGQQKPQGSGTGGKGAIGHLPPSPFADEGLGPSPPPRASLQPSLRRITDSDGEGEGSGGEDGADLEHQGKRGSGAGGGSEEAAPPHWDELCQPLPLVDRADAARFYTVLIIDEAIEEFAYRQAGRGAAWGLARARHARCPGVYRALAGVWRLCWGCLSVGVRLAAALICLVGVTLFPLLYWILQQAPGQAVGAQQPAVQAGHHGPRGQRVNLCKGAPPGGEGRGLTARCSCCFPLWVGLPVGAAGMWCASVACPALLHVPPPSAHFHTRPSAPWLTHRPRRARH